MSRIRLSEVAKAAHVSVSQASAALAGKPGVAPHTRAAVIAAAEQLGYRTDSAAKRLRVAVLPTIVVLVDPLLTEGARVASMSYAGRLLAGISRRAGDRDAAAVLSSPDSQTPPADALILIETGSHLRVPPDLGFGVPVVHSGVPWDGWKDAALTLTYDFAEVARTVIDSLQSRGCERVQVCRPEAQATWLHRLSDGCRELLDENSFHDYDANSAQDASRSGFDAAMAGDAVFLISNRRQGEVVAGVRRADTVSGRTTALVVLGEGVTEAAYSPAVGVLSLAPDACADLLIDTALWALDHPRGTRHDTLPFTFTGIPG
jgi:DNA-binding LacI/PurR family transcriptional regulator